MLMHARGCLGWRHSVFVFSLLLISAGTHAGEPAAHEREALRATIAEAGKRFELGDSPGCRSTLDPARDMAWRDPAVGNLWIGLMANCTFSVAYQPVHDVRLQDVRAMLEPWRERFAAFSPPNAEAELMFLRSYWHLLNYFGYRNEADRMFMPELRSRVDRLAVNPTDGEVEKALLAFAWVLYGSWQLHDYTRSFYELFKERLGEGHRVTLVTQRSLAYGERYLGRPQQALAYMDEAVTLTDHHHAADAALRLSMRSERAACLAGVGRLAEALADALLVRDAVLQREAPSWTALVRSHYNLAGFAAEMGDHRAAISYADQSIEFARRSGDPILHAEALVPGATREVSRLMLGEPGAAQDLKAALMPTNADEMHIGSQSFALVRHAAVSGDAELLNWSTEFMRKFIRLYRTPFHSDRSVLDLMDAWQRGGAALQAATVREPLERALAGSLTGRSAGTQALMHFNLARHLSTTDPDTATWLYKRAANALQRLRNGLPNGDAELHRAWLSVHEPDLRSFIALLIDHGRLVEAEQAVMLLRDEEITEYTRRSIGRRDAPTRALSYAPVESARNVAMEDLAQRVARAAVEADQRADAWRTLGYKDTYRDEQADAALAQFRAEVHELLDQSPALRGGAASRPEVAATMLPKGTARLTYFVRPDAIDVVLQEGRRYRRVSVPIARDELNRRVQALRAAVASPERDPLPAAAALHGLLVAPVREWLRSARSQHLQIVPDASLRYVPFAALHDGRRFLSQRFTLSIDLAGSPGRVHPPAEPKGSASGTAAFGRSVGDSEHSALPGVQRELAAVTRYQGTLALNDAFTTSSLRTRLESRPSVVHIASHFVIDPAGEDKSYLLLGDGRRLSLTELRQLPWSGVQLALLSACDSAVTVDAGHGRELVGFASALLGAGVGNVVASLWRVSDGATAEWMEAFYAQPRGASSSRVGPTMLARTQRDWLRRHAGTALAHAHYWAAFQWMSAR